jgi:two-component system sensor histidine kinase UhpB
MPFRRTGQEVEMRRDEDIDQGNGLSGKIRAASQQPRRRAEDGMRPRRSRLRQATCGAACLDPAKSYLIVSVLNTPKAVVMTLKARLIILVAGALLISLAGGFVLIALYASQWVQAEINTDARMARQLVEARVAEEAEETESPERIVDLLASLEASHQLHARYIPAGADPSPSADAFPVQGPAPSWLAPLLGVRASIQEIAAPRDGDGQGRIVITTDPATGIAKVWQLVKTAFLGIFLFSVSTLALVAFGLTHSLRPLGQLASGLSRIGDGDYSARVGHAGPTEIAQLGRHFDRMAEQLQLMQARTRALTAQLLAVQEHERRDIARDLHDEIGPSLLAANLDVTALIRLNRSGRNDAVEDCAQGLSGVLNRMQGQVRMMIGRLHLESAEPFDLGAAAADLVGFWRERCPEITWHLAPWDEWPEVSAERAVPMHRVLQEAVSNAVRHSGARNVTITCAVEGDGIVMRVRDDGNGIKASTSTGFGITGMRERMAALGGSLTVEAAPGEGVAVVAWLPLETAAGDRLPRAGVDLDRKVA